MILTRSGITRLVDRMVEEGVIRREPCPDDRCGHYAVITQQGKDTIERVGPSHSKKAQDIFLNHVSAEEAPLMRSVFVRVLESQEKS